MQFQPAIASPSLGHPTVHPIESRLEQAARAGFKLIELVEEDLISYAKRRLAGGVTDANQILAAESVKRLCDELGIKPFVLQPFWFYEGLTDRKEHELKIAKLRLWMKLVKALDVQLIQIPTNWQVKGTTGDIDIIVQDLIEMADIGLEQNPVVSFAYEAVAWGTHIDLWQGSWEIVKRVNKPNFGLCLDTYHIVARVWGDPTESDCKHPDGDILLQRSLDQLVKDVDRSKIFYVQVGDAEKLDQALIKGHPYYDESQLPRMSWSRNARLFFEGGENGGCLPIEPLVDRILNAMNFQGYLSVETFSRSLFDEDPDLPSSMASKGMESWKDIVARKK